MRDFERGRKKVPHSQCSHVTSPSCRGYQPGSSQHVSPQQIDILLRPFGLCFVGLCGLTALRSAGLSGFWSSVERSRESSHRFTIPLQCLQCPIRPYRPPNGIPPQADASKRHKDQLANQCCVVGDGQTSNYMLVCRFVVRKHGGILLSDVRPFLIVWVVCVCFCFFFVRKTMLCIIAGVGNEGLFPSYVKLSSHRAKLS